MKQLTAHFINKIDLYTPVEAAAECIDKVRTARHRCNTVARVSI